MSCIIKLFVFIQQNMPQLLYYIYKQWRRDLTELWGVKWYYKMSHSAS